MKTQQQKKNENVEVPSIISQESSVVCSGENQKVTILYKNFSNQLLSVGRWKGWTAILQILNV